MDALKFLITARNYCITHECENCELSELCGVNCGLFAITNNREDSDLADMVNTVEELEE